MKLSKETVNIFKNFAAINTNLLLTPGSKLATKSAKKTITGNVTVSEDFPIEFGIYDLNEFLGALALFSSPDLEFTDKYVTIKENNDQIKVYKAEKGVLVYQEKEITFPEVYVDFTLPSNVLSNIQRTAAVLHAEVVSLVGKEGQLILQVGKQKQEANSYQNIIGTTDKTFKANILVEHFKMIPGEYQVTLSSRKISRFQSNSTDLVYHLAVEADSIFE
jgi:hypothetical protein